MFTFNNKGVHFNTKYLSAFVVNKPVYNVNLVQTQGGTINASPLTGYENTEVTLSNTPETDYEFDSYSLTGATLYDDNKFILNNDVTAQASWTYVPPPTPPDEVIIGSATWKAQDLAVDDGGSGIYVRNNVTVNGVNLGTKYYYTWDAARRVANNIEGWHLPTDEDASYFINYVYNSNPIDSENFGRKTRTSSGWTNNMNGWGTFDFNSDPAGYLSGQTYNNMNLVLTGVDNDFWVNSSAWHYDEIDFGDFIYYISALGYGSVYNRYSAYTNYPNIISTETKYPLVKTWLSISPTVTSTEQPMALTVRLVKDVPVPTPPLSANTIRCKFSAGYTPLSYLGDNS